MNPQQKSSAQISMRTARMLALIKQGLDRRQRAPNTLRGLRCLGVATAAHIADYYRLPLPVTRSTLQFLETTCAVIRVRVAGWREPAYVLPTDLGLLQDIARTRRVPTLTAFLSPFDNLISYRPRVKELFNFEYRSEMYTPIAKQARLHGYYVMPILSRGRFVGRLDPKVDRARDLLILHNISLEPDVEPTPRLTRDIAVSLREFMQFHHCHSIQIGRATPPKLGRTLLAELRDR